MPDRAILVPKARFDAAERFSRGQPPQHVADERLVDVEFRDRSTDILISIIAEEIEIRVTRPLEDAVTIDEVDALGGVVEYVAKILFVLLQRDYGLTKTALEELALPDFVCQRVRALL